MKIVRRKMNEEAPVNNVGGGNIAGLGVGPKGEPGVTKSKYKRDNEKTSVLRRPPLMEVERGQFAGMTTFKVPSSIFEKARLQKRKHGHWTSYLEEDVYSHAIREYANKNPHQPIIFECGRTGAMVYARYGGKGKNRLMKESVQLEVNDASDDEILLEKKNVKDMTPDEVEQRKKDQEGGRQWHVDHPVHHMNIVNAYKDATKKEKHAGKHWYKHAQHISNTIADATKTPRHTMAGLISVLSPQKPWHTNIVEAGEVAHSKQAVGGPGKGTGVMASKDQRRRQQRLLGGKHNDLDHGPVDHGEPEHHEKVLIGHKTRAFAHLIEHGGNKHEPGHPEYHDHVVVDRHAHSVASGARITEHAFDQAGLDGKKKYEHVAQAYRDAADHLTKETGIKHHAHQVQAATWLRQQRINTKGEGDKHGVTAKAAKGEKKWRDFANKHHPELIGKEPGTGYKKDAMNEADDDIGRLLQHDGDIQKMLKSKPEFPTLTDTLGKMSKQWNDMPSGPTAKGLNPNAGTTPNYDPMGSPSSETPGFQGGKVVTGPTPMPEPPARVMKEDVKATLTGVINRVRTALATHKANKQLEKKLSDNVQKFKVKRQEKRDKNSAHINRAKDIYHKLATSRTSTDNKHARNLAKKSLDRVTDQAGKEQRIKRKTERRDEKSAKAATTRAKNKWRRKMGKPPMKKSEIKKFREKIKPKPLGEGIS